MLNISSKFTLLSMVNIDTEKAINIFTFCKLEIMLFIPIIHLLIACLSIPERTSLTIV